MPDYWSTHSSPRSKQDSSSTIHSHSMQILKRKLEVNKAQNEASLHISHTCFSSQMVLGIENMMLKNISRAFNTFFIWQVLLGIYVYWPYLKPPGPQLHFQYPRLMWPHPGAEFWDCEPGPELWQFSVFAPHSAGLLGPQPGCQISTIRRRK